MVSPTYFRGFEALLRDFSFATLERTHFERDFWCAKVGETTVFYFNP
jgi:hypothetical protein